jgi:hypothetical protein
VNGGAFAERTPQDVCQFGIIVEPQIKMGMLLHKERLLVANMADLAHETQTVVRFI